MKCLRCGTCCKTGRALIVIDRELGPVGAENVRSINLSKERCLYLIGDKPGEYDCSIHDEPWYDCTPCYAYTREIPDIVCPIGIKALSRSE